MRKANNIEGPEKYGLNAISCGFAYAALAKWLLEFLGIPRNKGVNFHGKFGLGIPRNSNLENQ